MEINSSKNKWPKRIIAFVVGCVVLSTIIKVGSRYYFDNYWTPGSERILLTRCISESRESAAKEISDNAISEYCDCNLQKVKAKYKPNEVANINTTELETFAIECMNLIK
jgi:hypothetical protein